MTEILKERFHIEHQEGIDLRIYDPAFRYAYNIEADGHGDKIDALFYDILTSPVGLRALGINQLSKSEVEETYEGSESFKRWQHVAGVYYATRFFARQQPGRYSDEQIAQFALVACIPDLGHGVKSHVSDMLKEGMGGPENFHDQRKHQTIDYGELEAIFKRHDVRSPFDSEGRLRIKIPKWVECDPPGINVDRLHYINAEISQMFPGNKKVRDAIKLDNFFIYASGELAFKDIDNARVWAKAANICSSEHWNDPINRLIELLSLEAMKRTISMRFLKDIDTLDNGYIGKPEDYTFLIDQVFDDALEREALSRRPDLFMNAVYSLIQSIAFNERQRFAKHKRHAYEQFMDDEEAREYPNSLVNPHLAAFGIPPAQVEILSSETMPPMFVGPNHEAPLVIDGNKTVGILKQLKFRQFDPLVKVGNGVKRLSDLRVDKNFQEILNQNERALTYVGKVALHANPDARAALIDGVEANARFVEESKHYDGLSPDQIRRIIISSGQRALELAILNGYWVEL